MISGGQGCGGGDICMLQLTVQVRRDESRSVCCRDCLVGDLSARPPVPAALAQQELASGANNPAPDRQAGQPTGGAPGRTAVRTPRPPAGERLRQPWDGCALAPPASHASAPGTQSCAPASADPSGPWAILRKRPTETTPSAEPVLMGQQFSRPRSTTVVSNSPLKAMDYKQWKRG